MFLPQGADQIIYEMSQDPIPQRKTNNNIISGGISEAHDLDSNYPIGFNPDIMRHKPNDNNAIEGTFLHHPDYVDMVKFLNF